MNVHAGDIVSAQSEAHEAWRLACDLQTRLEASPADRRDGTSEPESGTGPQADSIGYWQLQGATRLNVPRMSSVPRPWALVHWFALDDVDAIWLGLHLPGPGGMHVKVHAAGFAVATARQLSRY